MVRAAFPLLTSVQVAQFICMEAFNVFKNKKGGTILESIADAKAACRRLVALAEIHGSALRVWGCGGGMESTACAPRRAKRRRSCWPQSAMHVARPAM